MARALTTRDAHALMNALVNQATGKSNISVVDTSTFVSAGEMALSTGVENVLNALALVLGRTFIAVRPYSAKLRIFNALNTGIYTHRLRKISYYSRPALAAGDWNTQLYTNLADGFDNGSNPNDGTAQSTASMWVQNQPIPLEINFAGSSVWQDSTTVYKYQLQQAFRDEASFNQFVAGIMTEKANDMESQKEAFTRMLMVSFIGGVYYLNSGKSVVNLTEAYNEEYGTAYTSEQLRTTYLKEFLAFFVEKVKMASDLMTHRTSSYHWNPTREDGLVLLRHTPKDKQRLVLYNPLFVKAEANVLPQIFNPQYLSLPQYEGVDYWQSFNTPEGVKVNTAIPSASGQIATGNIDIPYVVGMLFDEDAAMVDFQLEDASTTPLESRKRYYNLWWSVARGAIADYTENCVLFVMTDVMTNITVESAAGTNVGDTAITLTGYTPATGDELYYKVATAAIPVYANDVLDNTWTEWDGEDDITAATGKYITVVVVDKNGKITGVGNTVVTAKA